MKHKIVGVLFCMLLFAVLLVSCTHKPQDPTFFIDANGDLVVEYADGKQQILGNVKPNGTQSKNITGAELNSGGELILTYSDGATVNLGGVKAPGSASEETGSTGESGNSGIVITGAQIVNGELILSFSNGLGVSVGKIYRTEGKAIESISIVNGGWCVRYTDGTVQSVESKTDEVSAETPSEVLFRQSGRAESDVSKTITLWANWEAVSYDGKSATVNVKVGLTCWQIEVSKRTGPYAGTITVNGQTHNFETKAISHMTREEKSFRFAEYTFQISLNQDTSTDLNIAVTWPFNGKYGGQEIGLMIATDTATLPGGSSGSDAESSTGYSDTTTGADGLSEPPIDGDFDENNGQHDQSKTNMSKFYPVPECAKAASRSALPDEPDRKMDGMGLILSLR